VEAAGERARAILARRRDVLEAGAVALLEEETLSQDQLAEITKGDSGDGDGASDRMDAASD